MLAQVLISACLVIIAIRQIDLNQAKSLALRPHALPYLLAALLLFNLSKVASALRLNAYQRHASIHLSERENLRLYYAGMFLNLFLPGGIGGDGYKILVLHRRQAAPVKTLLWTTLADRVNGMLILLILLSLLVPFLDLPWPASTLLFLAGAGGLAIISIIVLLHHRLLKMVKERFAVVVSYGTLVQVLQLACMGMLLAYLGVPKSQYLAYLSVFLVSSVVAVLPLSIGGLGAREVTFLYGLQLLQLEPTAGVVASSGFFLITVASSLLGALFLGSLATGNPAAKKLGERPLNE
jgi:uncharacterized membrane protein YbhN (UPF0104 family)